MAEQLDMSRLNLNDSQHAGGPGAFGQDRAAYIPPHLRGRPAPGPAMGGPPMMNGGDMNGGPPGPGLNGSAWGPGPGSVHPDIQPVDMSILI